MTLTLQSSVKRKINDDICVSQPPKKKTPTCSKCDKKGHNSRTCRKTKVKKSLVQIIIISKMGRGPAGGDYIFIFIPLGNKVYEGFGTFSGILFNDNFTLNFGTCR